MGGGNKKPVPEVTPSSLGLKPAFAQSGPNQPRRGPPGRRPASLERNVFVTSELRCFVKWESAGSGGGEAEKEQGAGSPATRRAREGVCRTGAYGGT